MFRRPLRASQLALAALLAVSVPMFAGDVRADGPAPAAEAPKPLSLDEANTTAKKVQDFYDKTTSFSSDFTQEFFVKLHGIKKTSNGHVTFSKPGKMNWEYKEPKDNRVVSDGSQLKVYEASNKQMFQQTVDKSQYPAALSFLVGGAKLTEIFNFELYDGGAMNFPGGMVLVGTPKTASPAYTKVLFYVDKDSSQVRRVLIVDGQGNRNRFDFQNPRVNDPVKEDSFKFEPPAGTSIVKP